MTYSKYACDICGTTAEPDLADKRRPPNDWEPFLFTSAPDKHGCSSVFSKDICPDCTQRSLIDLLAVFREKQEGVS